MSRVMAGNVFALKAGAERTLKIWRDRRGGACVFVPSVSSIIPGCILYGGTRTMRGTVAVYCFSVKELLRPNNSEVRNNNYVQKNRYFQKSYTLLGKVDIFKNRTHFSEKSKISKIVHTSRQNLKISKRPIRPERNCYGPERKLGRRTITIRDSG